MDNNKKPQDVESKKAAFGIVAILVVLIAMGIAVIFT
jgi:hypothetical protein